MRGPYVGVMAIDTRTVALRVLKLDSPALVRAELERLELAAQRGALHARGNWTAGTIFNHLAWWVEAIDRPELIPRAPWIVRMLGPLMKGRITRGPLPKGFKIPGTATGTRGDEPTELAAGLARYRGALTRLERADFPARHPLFGAMRTQDWVNLHMRHAEHHLGYLEVIDR